MKLPAITIPDRYNYIATFLTLNCNLRCSYCINRFSDLKAPGKMLSGKEWIAGLSRIVSRPDLPVTLGGGEPTLHPDFHEIVNGISEELNIDLLTNLQFDISRFKAEISPERIKRESPYASIRVSYHPEVMDLEALVDKVLNLQNAGYSIGIWGVLHPLHEAEVLKARDFCIGLGIDFRTKEFLGEYDGIMYGSYSYPGAFDKKGVKNVRCRTSELIIGPGGDVFRCHSDLYDGFSPVGNILDPDFYIDESFRSCERYGFCNPCDVKLKTDRFQVYGHTSVEIIR
ncbi:MAG: radical SAM protein [Desulfuromonadaceae bacterium]|nr:radical SAM protein [Desulfuromonadaceae bacterium]MDD2854328.1 radical SAM protein [Desulfuromonadaceae bacterium]